jgi:hypothetical protein
MDNPTGNYVQWNQYAPLPQTEFTKSRLQYHKKQSCCEKCMMSTGCDRTTIVLCGISFVILLIVVIIVVLDFYQHK